MIPREILKKIRQIEIRTNRVVTGFSERGCVRIPTGFCPKAQGCAASATLGRRPTNITNRNAVAAISFTPIARDVCHNPVGVALDLDRFTQGSSFLATLGWMTQSLWDWPNRLKAELQAGFAVRCGSRNTQHASRFFHSALRTPHSALI
jgi:hypothetical protein